MAIYLEVINSLDVLQKNTSGVASVFSVEESMCSQHSLGHLNCSKCKIQKQSTYGSSVAGTEETVTPWSEIWVL